METLDPLSTISHQLRTPLTVIISTVNNLLDGAFGPLSEEQKKWLKKLEIHTNNLETLSNDLLSFLKSNSAHTEKLAVLMAPGAAGKPRVISSQGPAASNDSAKKPVGKPPTILIVDDEPDILDVIKEALEMEGLKSITASTGDEAVRLAAQENPDLVLMDMLLQDQNGLEICRRIKSQVKSFTPVILMTGQQDLREKISKTTQEADEILIKPFQMVELTARVASMLRVKKLTDELQGKIDGAI